MDKGPAGELSATLGWAERVGEMVFKALFPWDEQQRLMA